jgi:hypothetical protein
MVVYPLLIFGIENLPAILALGIIRFVLRNLWIRAMDIVIPHLVCHIFGNVLVVGEFLGIDVLMEFVAKGQSPYLIEEGQSELNAFF